MAKAKKVSYISVPSQIINTLSSSSLESLLLSHNNKLSRAKNHFFSFKSPKLWFFVLFLFGFLGTLELYFNLDASLLPFSQQIPCFTNGDNEAAKGESLSDFGEKYGMGFDSRAVKLQSLGFIPGSEAVISNGYEEFVEKSSSLSKSDVGFVPKPVKRDQDEAKLQILGGVNQSDTVISNGYGESYEESQFWKQPDGLDYKPCLEFSRDYRRQSPTILKDRTKYLLVVVSGGMNQQRNQIVDAVVIARILGASLVVPVLQVNVIWGDESEFSDIFDLEHFKNVLANDVRIVSSLPSTHIMKVPIEEKKTPLHVSPRWIRQRYLRRLNKDGVLLLRGLDSRLSKDLPSDLQKLRCKVAFTALRFAPKILELGNKLAERMRSKGPYLALHLRMEKDVWVRTGCLPGLSPEYDEMINEERKRQPELLTARTDMTYHERKIAGLCPLNALEVTRLLKALGAPNNARIYWAGGKPLGGDEALRPLKSKFPCLYNKVDIALPGELEPFANRASFMAAIDYIVSVNSDVFMASHGGNMGHAIQGQRAYAGHKKHITPNKRQMLPYFLNSSLPETKFNEIIKQLHHNSLGQPELRNSKTGRDVTKYPVPECMCNSSNALSHSSS